MAKKIIVIIALVCLIIFSYPTALNLNFNEKDDIEILLSKSLSSKKISLNTLNLHRVIFNEINGVKVNYNLLGVKFLSTNELLKNKNDKFLSINIKLQKVKATVKISYFKAGISYTFHYKKKGETWIETNSEWGFVKFEPSKPYYIYWEIIRLTNPNYMDFNTFGIPKDSLK
jgi:hypothetical protein